MLHRGWKLLRLACVVALFGAGRAGAQGRPSEQEAVGELQRALVQVPKLKLPFELPARGRLLSAEDAEVLVFGPGNRANNYELASLTRPASVEMLGRMELSGGGTALLIKIEPRDETLIEVRYVVLTFSTRGELVDALTVSHGVKSGQSSGRTETVLISPDLTLTDHIVEESPLGGDRHLPPVISLSTERVMRIRPDGSLDRGTARYTSIEGGYFGGAGWFVVLLGDWTKPKVVYGHDRQPTTPLKVLKVDAAKRRIDAQDPESSERFRITLDERLRDLTVVGPDGKQELLSRPLF